MSLLDTASLVITPNGTKAGTLYSVVPSDGSGDMTVTRATTATRVNSAGLIESVASNVPRLDYSNGTCPSILVEPQRTNLVLQSNNVNDAVWGKDSSNGTLTVTPNYGISPDGTTNATRLQMSYTSGGYSSVLQVVDTTPSIAYSYSVYIKSLTGTPTICFLNDGATGNKLITLTNQWVKYTFNIPTSGAQTYPRFLLADGLTSSSADILVYGAQLEAGSYATSYIPTTSASVTRNADVISKTGISSLIGQTEGVFFVEYIKTHNADSSGAVLAILSNNVDAGATRIQFGIVNDTVLLYTLNNYSGVAISSNITIPNGTNKIAVSYGANGYKFYVNGVLEFSNTSTTVPSTQDLTLGSFPTGVAYISDGIKAVALWKTQLTNTQLAQLTTI